MMILPLLATLALGQEPSVPAPASARPNVIVVLADDLGLGDVSPSNPECQVDTANLARLAAGGLTFTDAHSPSAVCTPSRYGLLTGRYSWRTRLERGVLWGGDDHLIPSDRPTVAHLLREQGYHTQMMGKWHLGWDWSRDGEAIDFEGPVRNGPDSVGFTGYFAHAASLDIPPYVWVEDGRVTAVPTTERGVTPEEDRYGWYREGPIAPDFVIDRILPELFERSVAYVQSRAEQEEPFFLYLALPAPHTPIVPVPPFRNASGINPYADFLLQLDHHMGELLDALDETGSTDDTLVVFTSDNGCSPQANFELLRAHGHDPCAGFRGHKADLYEGGHRVPLVVRWPGRTPRGEATGALASLTDLYATLVDALELEQGSTGGEDGYSWVPLFEGRAENGRADLIHHSVSGRFAIRSGPWKLLLAPGSGGWSAPTDGNAREQGLPPLQLYDLAQDPAETRNLVDEEPEVVKDLLERLERQVARGRSTPGPDLANDRDVVFLPEGVALPGEDAR